MRDFFINSLEKLVTIIVAVLCVGVVIAAIATMFSDQGGFFAGIGVLIAGGIYAIMVGGLLFLALGIYDNTRRTAEAVEKLAAK